MKDILELLREGKTKADITRMMHISNSEINKKLREMNVDPKEIAKAQEEGIQKRKEKRLEIIKKLIQAGKTQTEIATIMRSSDATISKLISKMDNEEVARLKEEGRIKNQQTRYIMKSQIKATISEEMKKEKEEARQARETEILELIRDGKTQTEIARILGKSDTTISVRISKMDSKEVDEARLEGSRKRKQLIEELEEAARKQENDEIKRLKQAGKTQTEIAKILGKSQSTISERISQMNARDPDKMQEIEQQLEEGKNEKERQRSEIILELLREGKIQINIAEIMGVTSTTISKWINQIDSKRVDEAKKQGNERILELDQEGKTVEEIAEIVGVSQFAIIRKINKMSVKQENQEEKQEKDKKEIDEMMEAPSATISVKVREMKSKPNYRQLKQKLKEHTITRGEIDDYRDYLDDKYNKIELKEVILMSNMYIKTKRISEAIKFLNLLIGNEDMEYLGKEKLIEARSETERIGKNQRARELVKNNRSISEIMVETGLKEIEVIRIRNEIQGDREI